MRAWQGRQVTIDGGLDVQPPSTHLWIWDLEILVSEPRPPSPIAPDATYPNVNRPWGGLNVSSGKACKFINLVIHDNTQGVSWWVASHNPRRPAVRTLKAPRTAPAFWPVGLYLCRPGKAPPAV